MSHTTTLKTSIKDVRAIRQAAKECGVELLENTQPRMYFANQHPEKSAFVLKLKGRYDVGLDKQADGTYALAFDPWGGDIHKELGNTAKGANATVGKFLQSYAKHAAINAATAKGYSVAGTSVDKHGNVNLILNVPG
jgi:hypothetical protein